MARFLGTLTSVVVAASMASCGGETPLPAVAPSASAPPAVPAATDNAGSPSAAPPAPAAPESPRLAAPSPVATYTGFAMPESVLYDADNDRYLVSNVNGNPNDRDNNGFISVLSVGSSRVDLQACKLEYSIVSPK